MTAWEAFMAITASGAVSLLTAIFMRLGSMRSDLGHHARRIVDHETRLRSVERNHHHVGLAQKAL